MATRWKREIRRNLAPHCPRCLLRMIRSVTAETYFRCLECGQRWVWGDGAKLKEKPCDTANGTTSR
jgi:tRNA(Ile2) C34 agmatinyltransferase TiaS